MPKRQYKVLVITSIEVEALDTAEAIEKAYKGFDNVKIDDFEFQVEEWD
jgi:nicotinate-nucleotide pyrophosphorylase